MNRIPISEVYGSTIQGEGLYTGLPIVVVRVACCNVGCPWCDSKHTRDLSQAERLSVDEIVHRASARAIGPSVLITGGEPLLYDLTELIEALRRNGLDDVHCETSGTLFQQWVERVTWLTISPKRHAYHPDVVDSLLGWVPGVRQYELKVVVFEAADIDFAWCVFSKHGGPLVLQVGRCVGEAVPTTIERYRWLVNAVTSHPSWRGANIRILPQLHQLIWPDQRGV